LPRPSDPGSHSRGLGKTTPPSEQKGSVRVVQKARGAPDGPLLHAEAREPSLQPGRDPATKARTQRGLSKQTLKREGRIKSQGSSQRPSHPEQRLGGSSYNPIETQRLRLAPEWARQTTPPFERKGYVRVEQKSQGTPDCPLAPGGGSGAPPAPKTKTNDLSPH